MVVDLAGGFGRPAYYLLHGEHITKVYGVISELSCCERLRTYASSLTKTGDTRPLHVFATVWVLLMAGGAGVMQIIFVPCGHKVCCVKCGKASEARPCPICRVHVTEAVQFFAG